jgi:hypothetical protein
VPVSVFITNIKMLVDDMEAVHIKVHCVVGKNLFFNHFIVVVLDTISNKEAYFNVYKG